MTAVNPCRSCTPADGGRFLRRGFTRHKNRICAACRRYGPPSPTPNYRGRAA